MSKQTKKVKGYKYGFDHTTGNGQKRLMAISKGLDSESYIPTPIDVTKEGEYGCDPLSNGKFKMVPSGDIVTLNEMRKRLNKLTL